jgi:hypothetical protein
LSSTKVLWTTRDGMRRRHREQCIYGRERWYGRWAVSRRFAKQPQATDTRRAFAGTAGPDGDGGRTVGRGFAVVRRQSWAMRQRSSTRLGRPGSLYEASGYYTEHTAAQTLPSVETVAAPLQHSLPVVMCAMNTIQTFSQSCTQASCRLPRSDHKPLEPFRSGNWPGM